MVLLGAAMLSGCASAGAGGGSDTGSTSGTPTASADLELGAGWVDAGRMIALTTWGSSTCIPMAEEPQLDGDVLAVTLVDPAPEGTDVACTLDYVQRATLVGVPEGVDPAADLSIEVTYASAAGETTLPRVPGLVRPTEPTDYAPSAGWVGDDGTFALVTWGSSSCAPQIEDVATTTASEVTVTFATPPADQVCTMDMAPRVALAAAEGVAGVDGAELVLQGDTFDGIRVPILG
jgi:hypothetical protein